MSAHTCHARDCTVKVRPELLMCVDHWRRVPHPLQRAVALNYRPGQCDDKRPSALWFRAANAAIGYVAKLEGKPFTVAEADAMAKLGFADAEVLKGLKALDAAAKEKKA